MKIWEANPDGKLGRGEFKGPPDDILSIAKLYFEWCLDTPIMKKEASKYKGETEIVEVPKTRAFTIVGLCAFMKISNDT